ncbi:MAG: hypothetical protein WA208_00795 [Thermoanaerobaculia bacterium]
MPDLTIEEADRCPKCDAILYGRGACGSCAGAAVKERHGGFEFLPVDAVYALVYLAWNARTWAASGEMLEPLLRREPRRGDLVVEVSTIGWPPDTERWRNAARVGIFDRMELEPLEGADPDYRERAYYVTPLDATAPVRWVNCDWMVLPKTADEVFDVVDVAIHGRSTRA